METLDYICPFCFHSMPTGRRPPREYLEEGRWYTKRREEFWHRCEQCGRFSLPLVVYNPNKPLEEHDFWMFSACPNAWDCELFDCYEAECETQRLRPQCLVAVHQRLAFVMDSLKDRAEKSEHKQEFPERDAAQNKNHR